MTDDRKAFGGAMETTHAAEASSPETAATRAATPLLAPYTNKYLVTWDMLQMETRKLARKLRGLREWKGIVAVSRGGLVPAGILARELDLRLVDCICIASYQGKMQGELKVLKMPSLISDVDEDQVIVVDDLADTGVTAQAVRKMLPRACSVTVYVKPQGAPFVDYYSQEIPQDTWIELPWDTELTLSVPLARGG